MVDLIESILQEEYCHYCIMFDETAPCERAENCPQRDITRNDTERGVKKWLSSFDTSSATKCFEAVNLLKQRLEDEDEYK